MATKRGSYAPRTPKPIIADDDIDAILARNSRVIPKLDILERGHHPDAATCVLVGKVEATTQKVYMMPYATTKGAGGELKHYLKYYVVDKDGKTSEAEMIHIRFDHDILSNQVFGREAAKSRWSSASTRKDEHRKWMLFVWQHVTGQELPTGKATSKRKRKRMIDDISEEGVSGLKKVKDGCTGLKRLPPLADSRSFGNSTKQTTREFWREYDNGELAVLVKEKVMPFELNPRTRNLRTVTKPSEIDNSCEEGNETSDDDFDLVGPMRRRMAEQKARVNEERFEKAKEEMFAYAREKAAVTASLHGAASK